MEGIERPLLDIGDILSKRFLKIEQVLFGSLQDQTTILMDETSMTFKLVLGVSPPQSNSPLLWIILH